MRYIDSLKADAKNMILACQKNRALLTTIIDARIFPYSIQENGKPLDLIRVVEAASCYLTDIVKPFLIEHPLDTVYDFMSEADFELAIEQAQTINTKLETLIEILCNTPTKEEKPDWFAPATTGVMSRYGQVTQNNNYYCNFKIGPLKISKKTIKSKTKKLKAKWTVDAQRDLDMTHTIDQLYKPPSPLILPTDI